MLRYIFIAIIGIIILGVASIYGLGKYILWNANEEGSGAAEVYGGLQSGLMHARCNLVLKNYPGIEEIGSEKQIEATCKCFSTSMFEKVKQVPPGELEDYLDQPKMKDTAGRLMEKCAGQSGLAVE